MDSVKLASWFIGPFELDKVVNPSAMRLNLHVSLKVHPSVHVTLLMPVSELDLVPQSKASPAPSLIDGGPAHTVWQIPDVRRQGF